MRNQYCVISKDLYKQIYDQTFYDGSMNKLEDVITNENVDPNSCDYHMMDFDNTEILGAFMDRYCVHGEKLKKILILGYLFNIACGEYY